MPCKVERVLSGPVEENCDAILVCVDGNERWERSFACLCACVCWQDNSCHSKLRVLGGTLKYCVRFRKLPQNIWGRRKWLVFNHLVHHLLNWASVG